MFFFLSFYVQHLFCYSYDEELDPDSGIKLRIYFENNIRRIVATDTNDPFTALARPNLCGNIFGIVYLTRTIENQEGTKHNNFGTDTITLQCHADG